VLNTHTASAARSTLAPSVFVFIILCAVLLQKTKTGRRLRITGSDPDVLFERGISPSYYRTISWIISGFFASLAGIFLVLKVSSFVPNISSGRGWIALAVVFLGRKKSIGIILAVLVFAGAEFLSNNLQGSSVPSGLLIALPYAAALLLFILIPSKK
jgi:simple sugar transport system permease protein